MSIYILVTNEDRKMERRPLKKIESETALLEKISLAIPGFRGYKLKEMRREADRLIRDYLYRKLSNAKTGMREVFQLLAQRRAMDVLEEADRVVAKLDRVAEQVNHAPAGYAGFFNAVKVHEEALERLIEFDSRLIEGAGKIEGDVMKFRDELRSGRSGDVEKRLGEIRVAVEDFEGTFSGRKEVMMGVQF
jgi:hypothetical protein